MDRVNILGIQIDNIKLKDVVSRVAGILHTGGQAMVATANPEIIMLARKDSEFAGILGAAEMVTADGIGLVIASKILGRPIHERVTGIDLTQSLFKLAAAEGFGFYFLGARADIVEQAVANIKNTYPGLKVVGYHHGYFKDDEEKVLKEIKETKPHILLTALGMGKQEKWIYKHQEALGVPVAIGVGGSFDVFAGAVKRAPMWMQKAGLEWLYRLFNQPSRFFRMLELPKFLVLVAAYRLGLLKE